MRRGKTMVASSFERTKPSLSPTRATSPRKPPHKALVVQEEYHDDDDGESVAMASVAIAKTP